jgi:hypothetical protein
MHTKNLFSIAFGLMLFVVSLTAQTNSSTFKKVPALISNAQIPETTVKATLREMLAKHLPYAESKFVGSAGYFGNGQR